MPLFKMNHAPGSYKLPKSGTAAEVTIGTSGEKLELQRGIFWKLETKNEKPPLSFLLRQLLFNGHVTEFAGFKDLATKLAFHVLCVFVARNDFYSWVLTGL